MANKKISDLPAISALNMSDIKEVSSGAVSYQETRSQQIIKTVANLTSTVPYNIGDLFYANSTTTLNRLADVSIGNTLLSGGVNTAPLWGKVDLTTTVTGILPIANGGTGISTGLVVTSWDGSTSPVAITAGSNITITGGVISSTGGSGGVTSITGTSGQVIASSSTGAVTLSLPQSIAISSSPQFTGLMLTGTLITNSISGTSGMTMNIVTVNNTPMNITGGTTSISGQFGGAITASGGSGTGSGS